MIDSLNVDLYLYILILYILTVDGPKMDIEFELRIFIVFNRSCITQQHQQHIYLCMCLTLQGIILH